MSNCFLQVAIFKNLRWPLTKPGSRIFLNFVKISVSSYEKLKLTGCIVTVVTSYIKRMTTPCLPMIGDFCNTVIVASLVKTVRIHPLKYINCWKSAGNSCQLALGCFMCFQ